MSKDRRLALVVGANLALVLALALVGLLSHSLGVLASGADYLGDALGTGLSLAALRLSRRPGASQRPTALAALANASLLLAVTLIVIVGAVHRLLNGSPEIHGLPVLLTR